jgi:hypothetical protein
MQHRDLQSTQGYIDILQLGSCFDKLHLIHMEMDCRDQLFLFGEEAVLSEVYSRRMDRQYSQAHTDNLDSDYSHCRRHENHTLLGRDLYICSLHRPALQDTPG